jgi:2-polyprenyl-6-methoxyphenol hydroxylase-like FAD-dependent oxidoreductase
MPELREAEVAIVGGGIAGPALACALASTGWRILLVERSGDPLDTARGDHLQPVTCEALAEWEVLDLMWQRGAERRLGSRYLTPAGELILHAPVDQLAIPEPYYLFLNHELISDALLAGARRNPNFELLRPATAMLTGSEMQGYGLTVTDPAGHERQVRASLVAAADGRASRCRRVARIPAEEYHYENPMLVLFAPAVFDDPRNEVRGYMTDIGVVSVVPRTGGQWKIGVPVPRTDVARWRRAGSAELGDYLGAHIPEIAGIQPQLAGLYPVAMINADRWIAGNLVLLGDACHALHPGRSQGMNIAIRAVRALARELRAPGTFPSGGGLARQLQAFEAGLKPALDDRLADNHRRGLEMDRLDPAAVGRMRDGLAAVAGDEARLRAYCMTAAGY